MISIIMPVYNAGRTLERAVRSIQAQGCGDWELLLVDDGSADGSAALCDRFASEDGRIRVIHQPNRGASAARNAGLEAAWGEWIAFCDADDWVAPCWLDLFVGQFRPGVDLIVQGFHVVEGSWHGGQTGVNFSGGIETGVLRLAECKVLGYLWSKMVRRDVVERHHIRFDEHFTFREDEDFLLRCMLHIQRMSCTAEPGYYYNVPDFSAKYSAGDCFNPFLSIYRSLRTLYGAKRNWLLADYEKELTQSLFDAYVHHASDRRHRFVLFRREVGRRVMQVRNLSLISRYIAAYVPSVRVASLVFDWKTSMTRSRR